MRRILFVDDLPRIAILDQASLCFISAQQVLRHQGVCADTLAEAGPITTPSEGVNVTLHSGAVR